jgi:hypothetical protein
VAVVERRQFVEAIDVGPAEGAVGVLNGVQVAATVIEEAKCVRGRVGLLREFVRGGACAFFCVSVGG